MTRYRVQCCTYNGHLSKGSPETAVAEWLGPTLEQGRAEKGPANPPDFVAVGFQEMIPLHFALGGFSRPTLDYHDSQLKAAVETHAGNGETYTLIAKHTIAGIALLVFARDKTVTPNVADVRVATAGFGIARVMGNKGAVGVRVTLHDDGEGTERKEAEAEGESEDEEGPEGTSFTFVTAHLAAHQGQLKRRAEDWRAIVERLVFTRFGPSADFVPHRKRNPFKALERYSPRAMGESVLQVYDTSYLCVFGDLNYRVDWPKHQAASILPAIESDLPSLLSLDQLTHERDAGRTLHHLKEGAIAFPPTYKFKVGTDTYKHTKRIPSWCDRILYATWADEGAEKGEGGADVELYQSAHKFKGSDHKPVTAIVALPNQPPNTGALRLPHKAPFAVDPEWRRKLLIGWVLDRAVGAVWCLVMLLGFGKDARLGVGNAVAIGVATYYRQKLFGL